jgi:hypothetical protein
MKQKKIILVLVLIILLSSIIFVALKSRATNKETSSEVGKEESSKPVTEENAEEETEKEEIIEKKKIAYISSTKQNIRSHADETSEIIDKISKGTAVEIIEEKEVIIEVENQKDKEESNNNQVENQEDEKEIIKSTWLKIQFARPQENIIGWIPSEAIVMNRTEVLSDNLKELDYSPQEKITQYQGNPRKEVRGIYLTLYSASNSRLDELIEMSKRTSINTFVIDVKDDNGHMLFESQAAKKFSPDANKNAPIKDIKALVKKLHDNDIYAIARIVSFKDPTYTKKHKDRAIVYKDSNKPFTNSDGLIWASPHDRELWEYNVEVSKEAAEAGFNEIQFDYVRFPASNGGKLDKSLNYRNTNNESKPGAIQNYLKYAYKELSPKEVYISADIYGLVGSVTDDMALGQYWEAVSNVVDYVSPMMYPSHYANGTYGLSVPDAYPYETIFHSTEDSVIRNNNIETPAKIRPWIQDFTASWVKGHIKYGTKQVEQQIKALEENGVTEFLLWNASNRYSEDALK